VASVQTRPANGGVSILMELGFRPGPRSMVILGESLRDRTSRAVSGITGLDVHRVDISFVGVDTQ